MKPLSRIERADKIHSIVSNYIVFICFQYVYRMDLRLRVIWKDTNIINMKTLILITVTRITLYWCLWVKVPGLYVSRTLALSMIMEIASGIWTLGDRDFSPEVTVRLQVTAKYFSLGKDCKACTIFLVKNAYIYLFCCWNKPIALHFFLLSTKCLTVNAKTLQNIRQIKNMSHFYSKCIKK